ncbi:MAG: energy-coupling factor ABC transporter ATP-binding protein [Clostridium sp.]|nr:energy-coupling factor ABC transporter ATP-binding protein [Clostridium sp.]
MGMSVEFILQARGLSFSYQEGERILEDVNVDIGRGEQIAVLGANGAGKSTFFLCLNGVLKPEKGDILLCGKKIKKGDLRELRTRVGIVFQDAESQIIASTVRGEVAFGPVNLRLPPEAVRTRTERALEYMNIQKLAERPPHYLSGGEKKQVTIADIIAMEPEVFIFDEPGAALDPVNQELLEEALDRLSREGRTLIVSTHDVDFAYRFAGRILVFSQGRIIGDGKPEELFAREEILKEAHLKQPVLYELGQELKRRGILRDKSRYPRSVAEFAKLL